MQVACTRLSCAHVWASSGIMPIQVQIAGDRGLVWDIQGVLHSEMIIRTT